MIILPKRAIKHFSGGHAVTEKVTQQKVLENLEIITKFLLL